MNQKAVVRNFVLILISAMFVVPASAQRGNRPPSAPDIMAHVAKAFEPVQDFTASVEAEVSMESVRIPKTTATLYFKKPDKIHLSSSGFAIIPRDGIALNPGFLREFYDATFKEEEKLDERTTYKLQLVAKDPKTRMRLMFIWVDPTHWTVAKIEAIPYEGRLMVMSFSYALQQEKFWMVAKMTAQLGLSDESERQQPSPISGVKPELEEFQRAAPRAGKVVIVYSNYKINTNLPDSVFEKKDVK